MYSNIITSSLNICFQVAIKIVSKTAIPKEYLLKFLPREVENHTKLPDHPHVVSTEIKWPELLELQLS